jgi:hypothetical protein
MTGYHAQANQSVASLPATRPETGTIRLGTRRTRRTRQGVGCGIGQSQGSPSFRNLLRSLTTKLSKVIDDAAALVFLVLSARQYSRLLCDPAVQFAGRRVSRLTHVKDAVAHFPIIARVGTQLPSIRAFSIACFFDRTRLRLLLSSPWCARLSMDYPRPYEIRAA